VQVKKEVKVAVAMTSGSKFFSYVAFIKVAKHKSSITHTISIKKSSINEPRSSFQDKMSFRKSQTSVTL